MFLQAINLLPANTQIQEIRVFLESVLEEKAQRKRSNQVLKSLLQAEFLRVSPGGWVSPSHCDFTDPQSLFQLLLGEYGL